MRSRISRVALLLALALGVGGCFLGRIGASVGHVGISWKARALLEAAELPGAPAYELSHRACRVSQSKFFDEFYCGRTLAAFTVVSDSSEVAWARIDEQLVLGGWKGGYWRYTRNDFGDGYARILVTPEEILNRVKETRHEERLRELLEGLAPGQTLVGLVLSFQTPVDVVRSRTCFLPCS